VAARRNAWRRETPALPSVFWEKRSNFFIWVFCLDYIVLCLRGNILSGAKVVRGEWCIAKGLLVAVG
jgi:hypothetical protein